MAEAFQGATGVRFLPAGGHTGHLQPALEEAAAEEYKYSSSSSSELTTMAWQEPDSISFHAHCSSIQRLLLACVLDEETESQM